ncbi:MAG TPA: prepilin-type N-terminal cleavage/methylation domain-containing protein [Candidatus Saccharimonadales bacterium]|nr:prepilin-type N-terminal cleavage/methylation domain-containing protein [Candidatus Saccharimonadales bacterium]
MLKSQKGFTIIEVMIVLVIAGLILLIIFLAIPALSKTKRNLQRKNDASHVAVEIQNWIANNNGLMPGYESGSFSLWTDWSTDCNYIINNQVNLVYYSFVSTVCQGGNYNYLWLTGGAGEQVFYWHGGTTFTNPYNVDGMIYDEAAQCPTPNVVSDNLTTVDGNNVQVALIYSYEASGKIELACLQAN